MAIVNQPLKVPRAKLVIDLFGVIFWTIALLIFCIAILVSQSVPKETLVVAFIPILFVSIALKDLLRHLRAKTIILREEGIEIVKKSHRNLFAWNAIVRASERRKYSGGLSLYCDSGTLIFIPNVVQDYDAIKAYVKIKTGEKLVT